MKSKTSLQATTTATIDETQSWSSIVLKDKLTLEHAAIDINTDRVLYHLHLELEDPIPASYLANAEYMTLTWPVGGIWKIMHLSDNNRNVHCMAWRKTEMDHFEVEELAKKVEAAGVSGDPAKRNSSTLAAAEADDLPPTLFPWKMQLGKWGHDQHWFLRDIMPPHDRDSVGSSHPGPLTAHLMAGFSPLEVQIEVNAITSVDTVGQTFTADVTWEVTMPAITTIREDSVLRELMDILEFDENQFEFTNVNSMQEERDMTSSLSPAGPVHFTDSTSLALPLKSTSEFLSHLQFSRRVVAVFSEEMTLRSFPVDQQKLTFAFSTGTGVRKSLRITPAAVDAGTFAIANYKLGNVFDVVHHDKVFVGEIDADGDKKGIRFEMMLERRPGYYVTNVAIPAGIITYLCFISYAPLSDGSLMDTGDRVQIVLTLLLTAVTFKNQVASLTPQISYFTTLDQYVFFCFIIACLVAIENALFPLFVDLFPRRESWQENSLLGFSCGFFTLVNIVWALYITVFVKLRRRASEALIKVHEMIRVLSASIPPEHREAVLHEYLERLNFHKWELPKVSCTEFGYLYVQLPDDEAPQTARTDARVALHTASRHKAEREFDAFKEIYEKLNPAGSLLYSSGPDSEKPLRAAKPNEAFLAGGGGRDRRRSVALTSSPVAASARTASQAREQVYSKYKVEMDRKACIPIATIEEAQLWSSVVLKVKLTFEHAAIDIETKRVLYHLHLELETPMPVSYLANTEYMTLTWPVGGIWKIMNLSDDNRKVHCLSWRTTEMGPAEVGELAKKFKGVEEKANLGNGTTAAASSDENPLTLFNWKMQLGKWGHNQHWFLRDIMPPQNILPGPLTAHLMTGLLPLEVQIEVNALTAVDTVGQTFSADVTWEVTMPAITTIREESVMLELLEILECDPSEFAFANVSSVQEERALFSCLSPAGPVIFTDSPTLESATESLNHLQISRRIVGTFAEEMTVYSFPVDQQKLTFGFTTGTGLRKSMRITPASLDAGSFAVDNYKLGNVFDVVYNDKIFVGEINSDDDKKGIRFEMMLERRPGYYVTNVAIPAGIITYLCFTSYVPLADGKLIETGDRLQIVLTLLLTAVTFKNQVASLTPQISYFTTLDKYVFFCFIIACLVVVENALFPIIAKYFSEENYWRERKLLFFSIGFFTLVNVVWLICLVIFVKTRKRASKVFLKVHEAIRVISTTIPAEHREAVLHEYLEGCHYQTWEVPKICCAEFGYLYVELPEDEPSHNHNVDKRNKLHLTTREAAEGKIDTFKDIYAKVNPSGAPLRAFSRESQMPLRAPKPSDAGRGHELRLSGAAPSSPVAVGLKRSNSQTVYRRML